MANSSQQNPQYEKNAPLLEQCCCPDPLDQFKSWYDDAFAAMAIHAKHMILGTVDKQGHSQQRVVLLDSYGQEGYVFYTSYHSQKADDIMHQPDVSLLLWWPDLERQIRISGVAAKTSKEMSRAYFSKRLRISQLAAVASPQSKKIPDREALDQLYAAKERSYAGKASIPCPSDWGGYQVKPCYYEFWQGGVARLHDRICYQLQDGEWQMSRLAP